MHHCHIFGTEYFVYGCFLCGVQPWEARGIELAEPRFGAAQDDVFQLGKSVVLGFQHICQSLEHGLVTRLVEIQLHTQILGLLHIHHGIAAWHYHHHASLVGIAYRTEEGVIRKVARLALFEKADGLTIFEKMFYVRVFAAGNLYYQLIQRIVETASCLAGKPAHATFHLASHTHGFGLPLKLLLLIFILHAEQELLALQVQYRALGHVKWRGFSAHPPTDGRWSCQT